MPHIFLLEIHRIYWDFQVYTYAGIVTALTPTSYSVVQVKAGGSEEEVASMQQSNLQSLKSNC